MQGQYKRCEKRAGSFLSYSERKLEDAIKALGYTPMKVKEEDNTAEVLDMLDKGEITADQAINLLKK